MNTVEGKIYSLNPMSGVSKSGNNWTKTEVVIDLSYPGCKYAEYIKLDFFGERSMAINNNFQVGQRVHAYFQVRSRSVNGNWFHDVSGLELEHYVNGMQPVIKEMNQNTQQQPQQAPVQQQPQPSAVVTPQADTEAIPF